MAWLAVKIGRVFPDLLTPLATAKSLEEGLGLTLARLVALTGAAGGALTFRPPRGQPLVVTRDRALPRRVRDRLVASMPVPRGPARLGPAPGSNHAGRLVALRLPLGSGRRLVGNLTLVGRPRSLGRHTFPAGFGREFGAALERVWQIHRRTLRMAVLGEVSDLLVSGRSLDDVLRRFADAVTRLVDFDSIGVSLVDGERGEFHVLDVLARSLPLRAPRDARFPLEGTLLERVVATRAATRVDDLMDPAVPARSRVTFAAHGYRSAILVPLASRGRVFGAVTLACRRPGAFEDDDIDLVIELARPLASAIEQHRLADEGRRHTEELAALYDTSRLITARLDLPSVLDAIARSVTALTSATGCGIGLVNAERTHLVHVAAHGFKSDEWRALSMPIGEGIMGRAAAGKHAIRVDDVRLDPRSARRDVDEREGIRSMLCVPLRVADSIIGVISAFSTRPGVFTGHHQRLLEAFAEQSGIAIHNARLFDESVRRARETRALLEAGRAVTASLDPARTIRVILEQAKAVLGVESCGLMTVEAGSGDLVSVASLDLPPSMVSQIRLREGEGIAGLAVRERRPVQSRDLAADARVRYAEFPRASGFRSMLAAPLRVGERAIGSIIVFRKDAHEFAPAEEELLLALADQAAIALEHARLYTELEGMVAERTRELDAQKRFVEVVLETLPLGLFVLDADLSVVRANREGATALGCEPDARCVFPGGLMPDRTRAVEALLREAFETQRVGALEEEITVEGAAKTVRLTVAPFRPEGDGVTHVVVLVEDITLAKRLERQMLLTERLTTAGRLASGVAHELNNPLATIAGCAESLRARLGDGALAARPDVDDFRHYLVLIEEEAYRCKEITGSLLQFVREPGSRRGPTDLNALVGKTIELLSHQARFGQAEFVTELDPDLPPVAANEGQMRQVFLGLAANGLEAMESRGRLTIRSRARRGVGPAPGEASLGEIEVEFEDEGSGIPDEILPRIFDPFFTTKPPGQGTGLGLAIAQSIVNDHGGRIEVASRPGKGTLFRVVLPA